MEEKSYPPKVRAMFEAVLDLFASGRELSTLKVSEITAKAGIGVRVFFDKRRDCRGRHRI